MKVKNVKFIISGLLFLVVLLIYCLVNKVENTGTDIILGGMFMLQSWWCGIFIGVNLKLKEK